MCLTTPRTTTNRNFRSLPRRIRKDEKAPLLPLPVPAAPTTDSYCDIASEVFPPFLLAGLGVLLTGLSLDRVQHWEVFRATPQLVILIPSLLGLKGNLEMTLASRLSTQVNLGMAKSRDALWNLVYSNMALLLCQGTVVGCLAAGISLIVDLREVTLQSAALTCASSVVTALLACLLLGSVTMAVVFVSHKYHINPDNVAAPIASAFGDVTTLWLLTLCSTALQVFSRDANLFWIVGAALALAPLLATVADRSPYTHQALRETWLPVVFAICLSSGSGLLLSLALKDNSSIAVFQPVINGIGGNLVAVQASRLSTFLHKMSQTGRPFYFPVCFSPCSIFSSSSSNGRSARVLFAVGAPGQAIFLALIYVLKLQGTDHGLSPTFFQLYLLFAALQVAVLLYSAQVLISALWRLGVDPDNTALPCLTALGDLLGTALLVTSLYSS